MSSLPANGAGAGKDLRGNAGQGRYPLYRCLEIPGGDKGFSGPGYPDAGLFTADGEPYKPGAELAEEIPFIFYKTKDTDELVFTVHEGGLTQEQMRAILMEMGVAE